MRGGRCSRRELLASAAAAGALAASAVPAPADAATDEAATVNKVLAAELLAVFCYQHVLGLGTLGSEATALTRRLLAHEQAHVRALQTELQRLGASPVSGPVSIEQADAELKARHSSGRLTGLHNERITLDFIYDIEAITIGAHDTALETLSDPRLIGMSANIMAVEAQHAAAIGALLHPGNFDRIVPVNYVKGKS